MTDIIAEKTRRYEPKGCEKARISEVDSKTWCRDCKCNGPAQAGGTNNGVFHVSLCTCNKQVPKGLLEGGVAFPSGWQHSVCVSRTMDIIYASFLKVCHKTMSPQGSSRLSPCLQKPQPGPFTAPQTLLCGQLWPTEGHRHAKWTRTGWNHPHLIPRPSELPGACISDRNFSHVFN